ncbi:patatin-like phospholipase family protein [Cytophagaceae bacterium YF14B1]|uniref:Patatin-like phospholipase family protein n=1 Tax=Xanthocytophaga flava TaxID=3048013 RepID=A0AAE3UAL7_9BACT|nr:patatin-like phospholipase family protein [Xanthocytophaga flavus]MDJ1485671.1 patatin-like phospholipase family protein [Xanthocytophaga flavus]
MLSRVRKIISDIWYFFPVQLLVLHLKKNQWLLLFWAILFGFVLQGVGTLFGLPYLFLDPEYNHQVNFASLLIIGITLGGFTMAFHITCYILDAHRCGFLGNEKDPFRKFSINNSTIPLIFLITYLVQFIIFQYKENVPVKDLIWESLGLLLGSIITVELLFLYFTSTNKDIFKVLAASAASPLQPKHKVTRVNVMRKKVDTVRRYGMHIESFLDARLRIRPAESQLIDVSAAMKVLRQNHLNAFVIQVFVFLIVIGLSIFRDLPGFQIPAGASMLLLFTLATLFVGAISFWLGKWSIPVFIFVLFGYNEMVKARIIQTDYEAFGLNYKTEKADYSITQLDSLSNAEHYQADKDSTIAILERWKAKITDLRSKQSLQEETTRKTLLPQKKPKLLFLCVSGGGERAALWTMRVLQAADSSLNGTLIPHTFLITGASGGLVGASYFRELYLRHLTDTTLDLYNHKYLDNIAKDNLNAITFSLVVSDMFFKFQQFNYKNHWYYKDRGYAFEQQLNKNTENIMDKTVMDYQEPERLAKVPMLLFSPTIINDGRKLYISPQHVSYMTEADHVSPRYLIPKLKGVEFLRFFEKQEAHNLRFLSALRMSATFPYITPNVVLPSEPAMEIMDAGLSDNFGISDAIRFVYVFREWIARNTSGVVFLSVRDTPKEHAIEKNEDRSLFNRMFTPISSLYRNWSHLQDINNDNVIEYTREMFPKIPVHQIEVSYATYQNADTTAITTKDSVRRQNYERVSLSWRLTAREKQNLKNAIYDPRNQAALERLKQILK